MANDMALPPMTKTFSLNAQTGLLEPGVYISSPNQDERPAKIEIDTIVVHNISLPPGEFGSRAVEEFFCNKLDSEQHPYFKTIMNLKVSSHLFIQRSGQVVQFVPFHKRAWHAGESFFDGKTRCNDFSIGIELEGADDTPFTEQQYDRLAEMIQLLMQAYPVITLDRLVGHAEIAPGRKTDPGPAFNWGHLKGKLA